MVCVDRDAKERSLERPLHFEREKITSSRSLKDKDVVDLVVEDCWFCGENTATSVVAATTLSQSEMSGLPLELVL